MSYQNLNQQNSQQSEKPLVHPGRQLVYAAMVLIILLFVLESKLEISAANGRIGISLPAESKILEIASIRENSPAELAGLRRGDVIVAVNRQVVSTLPQYDRIFTEGTTKDSVNFTVNRESKRLEIDVTPGMAPDLESIAIAGLMISIFCGLALVSTIYWREDYRARLLTLFVLSVAFEYALPIGKFESGVLNDISFLAYVWLILAQFGIEFQLVTRLPSEIFWIRRWPKLGNLPLQFAFVGAIVLGFPLIWNIIAGKSGSYLDTESVEHIITRLYLVWAVLLPSILTVQYAMAETNKSRNQAAVVLVGVIPWCAYQLAAAGMNYLQILPPDYFLVLQDVVILPYPLFIIIAIFRYDLFGLGQVVRRKPVYDLVALLVLGVLLVLAMNAWAAAQSFLTAQTSAWLLAIFAMVIGALAPQVREYSARLIERRVNPRRHALRQKLIALANKMRGERQSIALASLVSEELRSLLKLDWCAMFLSDPGEKEDDTLVMTGDNSRRNKELDDAFRHDGALIGQLSSRRQPFPVALLGHVSSRTQDVFESNGVEFLAPLQHQDQFIGCIVLSGRTNGMMLNDEETELLDLFSHNASASLAGHRLYEHATFDGLTGALRREIIVKTLIRESERCLHGSRRDLTVAMIDLDDFKKVNDTWGHLVGDDVLRQVTEVIQERIRTIDSIGRYGGEEFLVVLPETSIKGATALAEDLRLTVATTKIDTQVTEDIRVTISIGLASINPTVSDSSESLALKLIKKADDLLYKAKRQGKNKVVVGGEKIRSLSDF